MVIFQILFYVLILRCIDGGGQHSQHVMYSQNEFIEEIMVESESDFHHWLTQPRHPKQAEGNYCALNQGHTMCLYQGPSAECADKSVRSGLTDTARNILLDTHNDLRSRVARGEEGNQPPAANMRKLVWNTELEAIAQRWADQCRFDHDAFSARSKLDASSVGQNIYMSMSGVMESINEIQEIVGQAVRSWYNEVVNPGFNPNNIDPFRDSPGTGHYTQVVWADTSELGCGLTYYEEGGDYNLFLVCNYAVAGNMRSGSMYIAGGAGTQCPTGTQPDNAGLCD